MINILSLISLLLPLHPARGIYSPAAFTADVPALWDLRHSLYISNQDWPQNAEPCKNWTGIKCLTGRVIGIILSGLNRTQTGKTLRKFSLNPLFNLSRLSFFNASKFPFPGPIPDWFGLGFHALKVLDLSSSSISGSIPPSLGNLTRLRSLILSNNSLAGEIPPTLGQLSSILVLDLSRNLLTECIPSSFSSLRNLTHLDLSSNYLLGLISPGLGSLSMLTFLSLANNSFAAAIPVELGNLSQLVELDLGKNSLSGSLPLELKGLRSLQKMIIGANFLEGSLPDVLWKIPSLHYLDLSSNNLTGVLPNISPNLEANGTAFFNLSGNMFYGGLSYSRSIFMTVDIFGNYFEGVIPNGINASTTTRNCLRYASNQRSLSECRSFYADRNLVFDNFDLSNIAPQPLQL